VRFLIDECLHESLVALAHTAGFEATHVNYLGLRGKPDSVLAERAVKDEFTFVTNNRTDFVRLFSKLQLHPGLVILLPNVVPGLQRALFQAVLQGLEGRQLVNTVIEAQLVGSVVTILEYEMP